jgi:hypothetical protein
VTLLEILAGWTAVSIAGGVVYAGLRGLSKHRQRVAAVRVCSAAPCDRPAQLAWSRTADRLCVDHHAAAAWTRAAGQAAARGDWTLFTQLLELLADVTDRLIPGRTPGDSETVDARWASLQDLGGVGRPTTDDRAADQPTGTDCA